MKKSQKLLATVISIVLILGVFVYLLIYLANQQASVSKDAYTDWQTYENTVHDFSVKFPQDWYLHTKGFQPAPPDAIRFANFEKLTEIPNEFAFVQLSITQTDETNIKLDDIDSVKNYIKEGYGLKDITIDGQDAIKLTKDDAEMASWAIVMAQKGKKFFVFDAVLAENNQKSALKTTLDGVLDSFRFSVIKQTASYLNIEKVYAAPSCSITDAAYWPGSATDTRSFTNVQNKMGQSYTPTKATLCQVRFPVRVHPSDNNTTVWLRVKNQADQVIATTHTLFNSSETQIVFNFSSPINVNPGEIYRLYVNSAASENTMMYYSNPGGYIGGEAYFEGYAELEKDFSFLTRAMSIEPGEEENEEEPGEEEQQDGSQTEQPTKPATTESGKDVSEFFQIPLDQDAPKSPAKLDILKLRLTGITDSYADLEWTKVKDDALGGYILQYGKKSGSYDHYIDTGTANTKCVYQLLPTEKYYFVVKTYDESGNLSNPSNEVEAEILEKAKVWFWWIWVILATALALILGVYQYKKGKARAF